MKRRLKTNISTQDTIKTGLATAAGILIRTGKSPDEVLGDFFRLVQTSEVFPDGKTFIDLVPRKRLKTIYAEYEFAKKDPLFDLNEFVKRHFYEFAPHKQSGEKIIHDNEPIEEHIDKLWEGLTRRNRKNRGSLIALPHHYIVPGGRFSEQFYWDTYFIMLGLAEGDYWDDIEAMMKNYTYMIRKFGFIPTANRTYFLSRSQPPFLSRMVRLLMKKQGKRALIEYLPYLLKEYSFWMKGKGKAGKSPHGAYLRVVKMPDGSYLNRYFDNKTTPRPEMLKHDVDAAEPLNKRSLDMAYLHLRAAAESGWDFSSRWFKDDAAISSIQTVSLIPVDLNCLLYELEMTIAEAYEVLQQSIIARHYKRRAAARKSAIEKYCWSKKQSWFVDYNIVTQKRSSRRTLAAVYTLYSGVATEQQADHLVRGLEADFLKPGGLVTTLVNNGQQWDAPNGWAPLQWVAVEGLRRYGKDELAQSISSRWTTLTERVYDQHHMLIEKYDVVNESGLGGGGEYTLQEGFGWTNGVYLALKASERH